MYHYPKCDKLLDCSLLSVIGIRGSVKDVICSIGVGLEHTYLKWNFRIKCTVYKV